MPEKIYIRYWSSTNVLQVCDYKFIKVLSTCPVTETVNSVNFPAAKIFPAKENLTRKVKRKGTNKRTRCEVEKMPKFHPKKRFMNGIPCFKALQVGSVHQLIYAKKGIC
jgi:hypothetical protein